MALTTRHSYLVPLLLVSSSLALPAPQTQEEAQCTGQGPLCSSSSPGPVQASPGPVQAVLGTLLGGGGGDPPGRVLGDILEFGVGVAQGIFSLLGGKWNFFTQLLGDQEFQESFGDTFEAATNLTGQVLQVAVPVGQGIVAAVPQLVSQGSRFAGSVVRAANDTAPLILEGVSEFTDQIPLIAGFVSAYAEVNAEQSQIVAETFSRSLSCDLECRDLTSKAAKAACEIEFCQKSEAK